MSRIEILEAAHRPVAPLYPSVILFNHVVFILAGAGIHVRAGLPGAGPGTAGVSVGGDLLGLEIQVYVNGREWLARQLDAAGIGYRRRDNKNTAGCGPAAVAAVCERFAHTDWPPVLERQAALVNPLLPDIT